MKVKQKKKFSVLVVMVGIVLLVYLLLLIGLPTVGCVGSGGRVSITKECKTTDIFSNNCGVGACEPKYSVNKLSCQCWPGCFNGIKCINYKF